MAKPTQADTDELIAAAVEYIALQRQLHALGPEEHYEMAKLAAPYTDAHWRLLQAVKPFEEAVHAR